jgi:hypothetical protein
MKYLNFNNMSLEFVNGKLKKGIHYINGTEFIEIFCNNNYRKQFQKTITDIFDFARDRSAPMVFFGGSFVSEKAEPEDIDCIIVFSNDSDIPRKTENLLISGLKLDVLFASLENKEIIDTYLLFFSTNIYKEEVGIIQVNINNNGDKWKIMHQPDDDTVEIVKRAYINRKFIDLNESHGILVSIHGLLSKALWNSELSHISSSNKWIFAPFIYDGQPDLLINNTKRLEIIDLFRDWVYDIYTRYEKPISIIAHSFGTYIIAKYIIGFDILPISLNSIILTGSILDNKFDWNEHKGLKVLKVLNEIAPNDQWVKWMPKDFFKKLLMVDSLFGQSGVNGFQIKSDILSQPSNDIFTHNNVIKRDVIEQRWMPYLNANILIHEHEKQKALIEYVKKKN